MSHDMLAWDDDVDVIVYLKDIPKLQHLHKQGILRREQDLGLAVIDIFCRDVNNKEIPQAIYRK